jgi:hypothetical protein
MLKRELRSRRARLPRQKCATAPEKLRGSELLLKEKEISMEIRLTHDHPGISGQRT